MLNATRVFKPVRKIAVLGSLPREVQTGYPYFENGNRARVEYTLSEKGLRAPQLTGNGTAYIRRCFQPEGRNDVRCQSSV